VPAARAWVGTGRHGHAVDEGQWQPFGAGHPQEGPHGLVRGKGHWVDGEVVPLDVDPLALEVVDVGGESDELLVEFRTTDARGAAQRRLEDTNDGGGGHESCSSGRA